MLAVTRNRLTQAVVAALITTSSLPVLAQDTTPQ